MGRFIRATSLDELPQLINVLRGDMSLLGPRPPLTYHPWPIEEYTEEQLHMFDVRPGFSGWAQIHGRKDVEWNHRIELNVWYVRHIRFTLDVQIFFTTIFKVLLNKDNENKGETLKK
ncbi:sugar transferase [[Ruminococcus] lactaris]|uniref:sugar transferase n=1 Tax=[Ruminococcus] lactaris TaxID=46228 RepID=UPI002ED11E79